MINLWFPGPPVAKGRPRVTKAGITYTPAKTRKAEKGLRARASELYKGHPLEGPLGVSITFSLPIPVSWAKKKKELALAGDLWPTVRPDLDNYVKLLLDAMNGILWIDDSQIVTMSLCKKYEEKEFVGTKVLVEKAV